VAVRSLRRSVLCKVNSGSLDLFDQIHWIDPTVLIEAVYLLLRRGNC
jgi:hypothetical protein